MSHAGSESVALVTGAAQGIGQGIARALGQSGYIVVLGDVDAELVLATAAELRAHGLDATGLRLDVARTSDWQQAIGKIQSSWRRLDVLVNNAGISSRGTIETTDEALWDQTMSVN